jgi:UDP-perosamine 4-acetyltransferase
MRPVAIVGAGGHAREVLQILHAERAAGGASEPVGFITDEPLAGELDGVPILGGFEWFERRAGEVFVVIAVGTPSVARTLAHRVRERGLRFAQVRSPLAWVADTATVGQGSILFPGVVVNAGVRVGEHASINVAATVSHDTTVGSFCGIGPGAHIAGNVVLGEGCFVGMGANVMNGVTVGEGSVIGVGAAVIDDVPPGVTVVGVPAKVIGPAAERPLTRERVVLGGTSP